jgi:nucleotide-binding universal stress UspA family protein
MGTASPIARIIVKNILFPTDFSTASDAALPFALALAKVYSSTVLFAHVLPPEPRPQIVTDRVPAQDDQRWRHAKEQLHDAIQDGAVGGTAHKILLNRGDLADVIPQLIRSEDVDMIVLGTHGRRGVSKMVLGSGAEEIYRSASCPVLTVGPNVLNGKDWIPRRILCPVDLPENPEPVVNYALSLAEENEAQIILMHAVPMVPWQHRESVQHETQLSMEALIPEHADDWCTPEFLVRWDYPAEAIVHAAQEREADLVVMGVRKSRMAGWSAHRPWPIASEVVGRASCPVLTVRV